jgi:hypothetical protein
VLSEHGISKNSALSAAAKTSPVSIPIKDISRQQERLVRIVKKGLARDA